MVYLITYDLNSPGQNYDDVIQAIKDASTGAWCTFWKSSYLIKSTYTNANDVFAKIKPHLDKNDTALVIEVKNNKQGWLKKEDWDYIDNHIFR